ncbi:MAG: hypothetical protein SVK08_07795 [Halobacteriota archaeon]|nr:hypothetical protein [Halobacteriota archaeon]
MATSWTIIAGNDPEEGISEWTVDDLSSLDSKPERQAWCITPSALGVSANAAIENSVLTWGNNAAEDFKFLPEEVEVEPELTQGGDNWTILPEVD